MGPIRSILTILPLLLATPVLAQQDNAAAPVFSLPQSGTGAGAAPSANPRQQGPELDVFRPTPTPVAPPVIVAPTVTPTPAPTPAAARQTPPPKAPRPEATAPKPVPKKTAPAPETDISATTPQNSASTTPAPQPVPAPADPVIAPTPNSTMATAEPREDASNGAGSSGVWPWVAGVAALLAAAAFIIRHRRRAAAMLEEDAAPAAAEPVAPPIVPPVAPQPVAAPPVAAPPPAAPPPVPDAADRPWIDMLLEVQAARYSMMGVTIGYILHLHNRGDRPAQDIFVRGAIGNAGSEQQALLLAFFGGETGMPLHTAAHIPAGETRRLTGDIRLAPDQVVPVDMGGRALLIPLVAFDAQYGWTHGNDGDEGATQGSGRTGRAFIVGQEQEPPVPRLAPFRLDQGPRQFRRPAARAAGEVPPT
ncbi:MAG: hypothetical protein PSY12_08950 [bacterium]|nr:hypothetical protein [bacterium]